MKKLLATAHAAGYAMALPEDFDASSGPVASAPSPDDGVMEQAAIPSRALVPVTPEPARSGSLRDWIAALWVGRPAALS